MGAISRVMLGGGRRLQQEAPIYLRDGFRGPLNETSEVVRSCLPPPPLAGAHVPFRWVWGVRTEASASSTATIYHNHPQCTTPPRCDLSVSPSFGIGAVKGSGEAFAFLIGASSCQSFDLSSWASPVHWPSRLGRASSRWALGRGGGFPLEWLRKGEGTRKTGLRLQAAKARRCVIK